MFLKKDGYVERDWKVLNTRCSPLSCHKMSYRRGPCEMAQRIKAVAAVSDDLPIPGAHMVEARTERLSSELHTCTMPCIHMLLHACTHTLNK